MYTVSLLRANLRSEKKVYSTLQDQLIAHQNQSKSTMSELAAQYQKLQGELENFIVARQKLETQLQENKIVDDEFNGLKSDSKVYKLTGNVLLPVEQEEARTNVNKRLEFIQTEIDRCENNIKSKQEEQEKVKAELIKLRTGGAN